MILPHIIVLIVVGVLLIAGIVEGRRIAGLLTISRRLARSIEKFERISPSATQRILFLGDSTGYGTGTTHSRYSLVGRLGLDYPDAHIENWSSDGSSLWRAHNLLRNRNYVSDAALFDTIIIMVGGMDLVRGIPLWLVRSMLRSVISHCRRIGKQVVLVSPNNAGLAPLHRFPLSYIYQRRAKQFDSLYRSVAHELNVHYVSLYCESMDQLVIKGLFAPDQTHPNDEGYAIWYAQMREVIAKTIPIR